MVDSRADSRTDSQPDSQPDSLLSHNFYKAVKDTARQTFYSMKRNIKLDILIKNMASNIALRYRTYSVYGCECWGPLEKQEFTKWDKHQTETLQAEFCKSILQKHHIMHVVVRMQKGAFEFYNHLKENCLYTPHFKALTYRQTHLERCPVSQLVVGLCSQTPTQTGNPLD